MPGPALLTFFNEIAKSRSETKNAANFVEQALVYFDWQKLDLRFSSRFSTQVIAGEARYLSDVGPLITEKNIVTAYECVRKKLPDGEEYPSISEGEVAKLRAALSPFAPNLFVLQKTNLSPVEAIILLFLIIHNNGNLDSTGFISKDDPRFHAVTRMSVLLKSQLSQMSDERFEAWIDDVLGPLSE